MRSNSTEAEKHLWQALRSEGLGVKFRRQAVIGPYIVDFVCFENKLVVEVDGGQHCQNQSDSVRDEWFSCQGFGVLRFWNNDVLMSLYCFAASQAEEQYAKGRSHKTIKEIPKHFELSGKLENGIRVIEVKASRYKFEPDPIVVKLGEKVRLVVTSIDVAHGIAIQEFNVKLSIPAGKTEPFLGIFL